MNINVDCLRDVLKYCIDNIDYKEQDNSWVTKYVNLPELYESRELIKYSKKEIMRSVLILEQCGFIKIYSKFPSNKPYLDRCSIEDVTFRGCQFYESVRETTIWEKTKDIAEKFGNHTLNFIENVAHDVAVESAKQAITVVAVQAQNRFGL